MENMIDKMLGERFGLYWLALASFAAGFGLFGSLWWFLLRNDSEVLFFPDKALPCYSLFRQMDRQPGLACRNRNCQYAHNKEGETTSLIKIFLALNTACSNIDLCIFDFTFNKLAEYLITLHQQGIKIRVITDAHRDRQQKNAQLAAGGGGGGGDDRIEGQNDQIPKLQQANIQVRLVSGITGRMHNKFVLIDRRCVMSGSFNWTYWGVLRNRESVIKTNERSVVQAFVKEFDEMWRRSDRRPINTA